MVSLGEKFDATAKENNVSNTVPDGEYTLAVVNSEVKESKAGGEYLNLEIEIVDGKFAGRKIFEILCLWHEKEDVQKMARGKLSKLCRAIGKPTVEDTDELIGLPFRGKLKTKEDPQYGDKNVLAAIIEKPVAAKPAAAPAPSRPRAASTVAKPPNPHIADHLPEDDIPF